MPYSFNGRSVVPSCEIYHDVIPYLAGIPMHDYFMDPPSCAEAYRRASKKVKAAFGDVLPMIPVRCPPLSYGHIACIGGDISVPADAEPAVFPYIGSVDDGIRLLSRPWGFKESRWFRHYMAMAEYLRSQFPGRRVPFSGLGAEGPVTTAVLIRGQDFFLDLYDEPEKCKEFLRLLTRSIIEFHRMLARINEKPEVNPQGAGLCDDYAALIPPKMWDDFVVPYWNLYFEGLTTGTRFVHVEGCSPDHLKYLEKIRIDHYQPSVSRLLTIQNVKANTPVEFDWLLYAFRITGMSDEEISAWVDDAVTQGIGLIRTQVGAYAFQIGKEDRVMAFFRAFEKYRAQPA